MFEERLLCDAQHKSLEISYKTKPLKLTYTILKCPFCEIVVNPKIPICEIVVNPKIPICEIVVNPNKRPFHEIFVNFKKLHYG
jgi:hypothetical protein